MGLQQPITSAHGFFLGEDKTITFDVTGPDGVTPQVMTGWALTWELKTSAAAAASLSKTTGASTIALSNVHSTNDRATVTITDGDTEALGAGAYYHHLRRTDAGAEQVLAYGDVTLRESGLG
jgi:hypothetical protein